MTASRRPGVTLVELLVVIAIIGVLIGLLVPAVQAARESGRRTQCASNLNQMGIAVRAYHDVHNVLPSGFIWPNQSMWTGLILPFIEQQNLYDGLDFSAPWNIPGTGNYNAQTVRLDFYRCPSANAPEFSNVQHVMNRVPVTYLACATGIAPRESGFNPQAGQPNLDGLFFINSKVRMTEIKDGQSHTVAIGEALWRPDVSGPDHTGNIQIVDHWAIGSTGIHQNEVSEAIGSTAVAVNSVRNPLAFVDEQELCFSAIHPAGPQVVFADGHITTIPREIDRAVWSALGTRDRLEVVEPPE